MPDATYRHRAVAAASLDQVWKHLQDPETWAGVAGVDTTSDHSHDANGLTGFHFTTSIAGMSYRGSAQVTRSQPTQGMTLAIRSNELTGTIAVDLSDEASGTTLDVTMTMRAAGIIGTMIFPVVTTAVAGGFDESVERLAAGMA